VAERARRARPEDVARTTDAIEQAKAALRRNINPRLVLETLFMQLGAAGHRAA
jgi:hypothetical protein